MKTYKIIILLSYISIASASAVIINPALPHMSIQLGVGSGQIEWLVSIFLLGYVIGQLIYGPLSNRFGEVKALRFGLVLNLVGIVVCLFGGYLLSFDVLMLGRFITALGSSAGLVCTFIILNRSVEPLKAKAALSFASVSFALSLTLATLIGGMMDTYSSWVYCFYVLLIHGLIMYLLSYIYDNSSIKKQSISIQNILSSYKTSLSSMKLVCFSVILAIVAIFSYCYSAVGPFIVHSLFGFTSADFGMWNFLTIFGIVGGSVLASRVISRHDAIKVLKISLGSVLVLFLIIAIAYVLNLLTALLFFVVITLIYFVASFIYPAASYIASNSIEDKASASSMMNFINIALAMLAVSVIGYLPFEYIWNFIALSTLLPLVFFFGLMFVYSKK